MMRDPHCLVRPLHSARNEVCARHFDRNVVRLPPTEEHLEVRERYQDEAVEGLAEHPTLLGDRSDHVKTLTEDAYVLADRIDVLEQLLGDVSADDSYGMMVAHVDIADGTSTGEHVVLTNLVRSGDPEDRDVGLGVVLPHDVPDGNRPTVLHTHRDRLWHRRHHGFCVGFGEAGAPLQPAPFFIVEQSDPNRGPSHLERVSPDQRAGEILFHVRVHPRDDRDHRYQERDRHDDSEQRKEGPQLVEADLLECRGDYVGEAHDLISATAAVSATNYSYLSASTGSSLAARAAGSKPNRIPVKALVPSAVTTAEIGVDAGTAGNAVLIPNATRMPRTSPIEAPMLVSVAASTRHGQRIALLVAPRAFRTPISRVRSVTLIIMIATTPTPPTSNPTDDSASPTTKKVPNSLL